MKQRVTVTRKVVVEIDVRNTYKILHAAADARRAHPGIDLDVTVETLLDEPERRVVICRDEFDTSPLDADFEDDADRQEVTRMIERYGVWGFLCEQRDIAGGKWEHITSCWGFTGSEMLRDMREHMSDEFRTIEPIDEHTADRDDLEVQES